MKKNTLWIINVSFLLLSVCCCWSITNSLAFFTPPKKRGFLSSSPCFVNEILIDLRGGGGEGKEKNTDKSKKKKNKTLISSGLYNLGNTCYMNSQLECIFHIPKIRQLLQHSSSSIDDQDEEEEEDESVLALRALANVMHEMTMAAQTKQQQYQRPVRPTTLCSTLDISIYEQQDALEFWQLLLPLLNYSPLSNLFQGYLQNYIFGIDNVDKLKTNTSSFVAEKIRDEAFISLSLDIPSQKKSWSVQKALKQMFTTPELLSVKEGNGWRPDPKKKQYRIDALKGQRLLSHQLPSLLQLHLKRFQYNWEWDIMSKLNTRCTFKKTLNLSSICVHENENDEDDDMIYLLQSIIIHAGEYGRGHYYAYVRPDPLSNRWFRFNDDIVEPVSYKDVVRDAFGGRTPNKKGDTTPTPSFWNRLLFPRNEQEYGFGGPTSSAYVLLYVKKSDLQTLYQ